MKKNCSKTTQGLQTYLVPEWGVFFATWVSTTSRWASLLLFASWSGLKKLWAVACKSILRASPRAYWNSRGVVTRPSGRDDHQRWCFGWEIQGGNSGSPLKSLDVSWLSFRSLHTTSHLFFKSAIYGSSFFCRKKEVARWMLTPGLVLADISSIVLAYTITARMSQGPGRKRNLGYQ